DIGRRLAAPAVAGAAGTHLVGCLGLVGLEVVQGVLQGAATDLAEQALQVGLESIGGGGGDGGSVEVEQGLGDLGQSQAAGQQGGQMFGGQGGCSRAGRSDRVSHGGVRG